VKALVIEDESVQRKIIDTMLRKMDFVVVHAEDGLSGLQQVCSDPEITLAVVDWHCRPLDGIAFLAAVRADPDYHDLSVLMLTADNTPQHVRQARDYGADGYMVKPVRGRVLIDKLLQCGLVAETDDADEVRRSSGLLGIPPEAETTRIPKVSSGGARASGGHTA